MPRRRMVDPFFWDDRKVGKLSRDERSLIMGCVGHADDDGRLQADPAYLKSTIFKYDDDLTPAIIEDLRDNCLDKMKTWPVNHPYRMFLYINSDEEYLFFPAWAATNRPSHPTKSQLPAPPPEALQIFSGTPQEGVEQPSREPPPQSSLGQSSLGKVRLGQVRGVPEDFTKFLDNEKDLTDFLTTTLGKYMPLGPTQVMPVIKKLWLQADRGEMSGEVWQVVYMALQNYPIPVLAKSLVKAVKYSPGKTKPAKYIQTVFTEQMKEHERNRSP